MHFHFEVVVWSDLGFKFVIGDFLARTEIFLKISHCVFHAQLTVCSNSYPLRCPVLPSMFLIFQPESLYPKLCPSGYV